MAGQSMNILFEELFVKMDQNPFSCNVTTGSNYPMKNIWKHEKWVWNLSAKMTITVLCCLKVHPRSVGKTWTSVIKPGWTSGRPPAECQGRGGEGSSAPQAQGSLNPTPQQAQNPPQETDHLRSSGKNAGRLWSSRPKSGPVGFLRKALFFLILCIWSLILKQSTRKWILLCIAVRIHNVTWL